MRLFGYEKTERLPKQLQATTTDVCGSAQAPFEGMFTHIHSQG